MSHGVPTRLRSVSMPVLPLSSTRLVGAAFALGLALGPTRLEAAPAFERVPCFLADCSALAHDDGAVFGRLRVAENRSSPDGRTLSLGVVILRAQSVDKARPDAVFYLSGGPGVSALYSIERFRDHYLRQERDLVLMDLRATGTSEPKLCPGLGDALMALLAADQSPEEELEEKSRLLLQCEEQVVESGVDLGAYNAAAVAADVAELRLALGYQAIDLYGISYGTRYALTVLRDHPDGVRAAILDSAVPLGVSHVMETTANYERALDAYFAACQADAACAQAFPDLEARFLGAADSLDRDPLHVALPAGSGLPDDRFVVNGQDLHLAVQQILYDSDFYPILPLLIETFERRDRVVLARLLPVLARGLARYSFAANMLVNKYDSGMYLDDERSGDPALARGLAFLEADIVALRAWRSEVGGELEATPVASPVPTLIMAGELDPITPPAYGDFVARTLDSAHVLRFPGIGHGVSRSGPCPARVVERFLDAPTQDPADPCIAAGGVEFITQVQRNAHVADLGIALFQERSLAIIVPVALCVLVLFSGVLVGLGSLARPLVWRRDAAGHEPGERAARALMAVGSLISLGFLAGLAYFMAASAARSPYLLLFGLVGTSRPLFYLPYVLVVIAALSVATAWIAQRRAWWCRASRVHASLVASAHLGTLVLIAMYRLHPA